MADELITKRLHVSGLTPAITAADISQKLGSFGSVKALDGFGLPDALGQPRKFGYVTLETTKSKLAKCMNTLSGVTWRGTKIRIGEAKPDFRERIALEQEAMRREAEGEEPPRKKRRLPRGVQGVHAADMSLITPEIAKERGGWRVTPLGRVVRPMRMRPGHPLPPLETTTAPPSGKPGKKEKAPRKKRRTRAPLVRARRRTIDPTKWGSQLLKGVFLENASSIVEDRSLWASRVGAEHISDEGEDEDSTESEDVEEEEAAESGSDDDDSSEPLKAAVKRLSPLSSASLPTTTKLPKSAANPLDSELAQEKDVALNLLQSLFGNRKDEDWGDRESLGSDVEPEAVEQAKKQVTRTQNLQEQDEIEEVPMDIDNLPTIKAPPEVSQPEEPTLDTQQHTTTKPMGQQPTKLKDLFAPREEEAGFSLLGHLDLDFELDDDIIMNHTAPMPPLEPSAADVVAPLTAQAQHLTLDSTLPLFFPLSEETRAGFRGKVKDPFDVAKEKGWDWRMFHRTQNSEEIRLRWEEQKVELTKDWKRRHREAIKSRRRRGGADGEDLL